MNLDIDKILPVSCQKLQQNKSIDEPSIKPRKHFQYNIRKLRGISDLCPPKQRNPRHEEGSFEIQKIIIYIKISLDQRPLGPRFAQPVRLVAGQST